MMFFTTSYLVKKTFLWKAFESQGKFEFNEISVFLTSIYVKPEIFIRIIKLRVCFHEISYTTNERLPTYTFLSFS